MASIRKRSWTTAKGEKTVWFVDFYDAAGKRRRKQFATKRAADAYRVEAEWQLRGGTFRADASKVTIEQLAARFLEHCEGRMARGERMTRQTLDAYRGHIRNYIAPDERHAERAKYSPNLRPFDGGVGFSKIHNLTSRGVSDFRDRLRSAGVSVATTRKILKTLQLMFAFAISRDLTASNPARGVRVIGRRDEGSKKITPPPKEAMRLLLGAAEPDFRIMLVFASATGVRSSEMRALRWCHIDFAAGEVTIETRVDAHGVEDVTKTAAGMRAVPVGASVLAMLKEWRVQSKFSTPRDLVFPNSRGGYISHTNMVSRQFRPLFDKLAELHIADPSTHPAPPDRFNWHALRHFAISCWIEAGLAPKTVQTFAGHSSLQVTMDRYGHLFKSEDHRRTMDAIAQDMLE